MALNRRIFIIAFLVTAAIFLGILYSTSFMNDRREQTVLKQSEDILKEYEDMQTVLWMSELQGEAATCMTFDTMLAHMNRNLWDLGKKIDLYREATEEFATDPFYLEQKTEFNRKEVLYFLMLRQMKNRCNINQTLLAYFYRKKEVCPDCDAQSFVLMDIKNDLEAAHQDEDLAVFNFDVDTDLVTIDTLVRFYNVTAYPCVVLNNATLCGLQNKNQLLGGICASQPLKICNTP